MTEQFFWIFLPVTLACWSIAAYMFWRWDIGGFRADAERRTAERKDKK
jgi:uncharacterized membrane protein YccF (DUF307 family)